MPKKKAEPKEEIVEPKTISLAEALDILDKDPDTKIGRTCWPPTDYITKQKSTYLITLGNRPLEVISSFPREMIERDYVVL